MNLLNKFTKRAVLGAIALALILPVGMASADDTEAQLEVVGGALTLTLGTGNVQLGSIELNDLVTGDQSKSADLPDFNVTDARGTAAGWDVQVTATQFTSVPVGDEDPNDLPANGMSINGAAIAGNGDADNQVAVKTGLTDGTALSILVAAADSGVGSYDVTGLKLEYDLLTANVKDIKADAYVSTVTVAVVSAP